MTDYRWLEKLIDDDSQLPHGRNLLTQMSGYSTASSQKKAALDKICSAYKKLMQINMDSKDSTEKWIKVSLKATEEYLNLADHQHFSHQSDFKSSIIPEYLYLLVKKIVSESGLSLLPAAQRQIVIECQFVPFEDEHLALKLKRVDVAILKECPLNAGGQEIKDFAIPVVAMEVKTNLDKNMISGVEFSVESLKKTNPLCMYYLISEYADFAVEKQNYAGTSIDEIIILRKQKRSDVRSGSNPPHLIDYDLILKLKQEIQTHLAKINYKRLSCKNKMILGRLIG